MFGLKTKIQENQPNFADEAMLFVLCVIYSMAVNFHNNRDVPYNDFPTINFVIFENHPVCLIKYEHKNIFVFSWDSNAVSIVFFGRLVKLQKEQSGSSILVFYSCPNVRDCL